MSRLEAIAVAASLAVFLFFAAAWIHLPGPQHDELLHVPVLLRDAYVLFALEVGHWKFPVMIMSYVGALKGWLLRLWFVVVPWGVPGYRSLGITAGLVTVWMTFRFVRRYYGPPIALLSTALVSTDPSFVHTIRLDYGPVALMQFLKMGGLCLLTRWLDAGSWRALAGGMFLFGLGLWDKANFIWFLAGLGATVVLLFPKETLARLRAAPSALPISAAALLLGATPFLYYNVSQRGQTWQERGRLEVHWFKLLQARSTFEGTFMSGLTGEDHLDSAPPAYDIVFPRLADWMYRFGRRRETIQLPLLGLALLALPFNLWIGPRRRLLFPLLLPVLIYACMFVSFDGGSSGHHVIMLQPFPLLFLAVSQWTPAERWPRLLPQALAVAAALGVITVNLAVNARHLAIYTRTGGTGGFSDAMYRLVPYLARNPERQLYALDWGFSNPVAFLGRRSKLAVDDIFFALNATEDPNYRKEVERLGKLMRDPNNVFLLHSPQRTLLPAPTQQFFALADSGIEMRQVAFFQERWGEMIYEVYQRGAPAGGGSAKPEIQVRFSPQRVGPGQEYVIEVREFPNSWIDLVYHVDQASSGTATRFCRLDAEGRARLVTPATHPAATVRVTRVRASGGQWRSARGSIIVAR